MENAVLHKFLVFVTDWIRSGKHGTHMPKSLQRRCPVTGLDISMQKPSSKFLSATGVRWYFFNDPKTYKKFLEPRLTESWNNRPPEERFREIAHSVRNTDSNPRNSTKRSVMRLINQKDTLFNNYNLIDRSVLKKAGMVRTDR